MKKEKLIKIVNNFGNKQIGIIGDLMLDQFIWGDAKRISPEAPIPVVLMEKESFMPGGAANVANNISALAGGATVLGTVGKDNASIKLINILKSNNINTTGIIRCPKQITTQKIRIIAREQQLVRVDKENNDYINDRIEKKVIDFVISHIKNWNGLIISDYAKGLITKKLTKEIINLAQKYQKPIIGALKPKNASYFKNVSLLTLNYKEAVEIAGINDLKKAGKTIQQHLKSNLIITQGSEGMTIFEEGKIRHFPTKAKEIFDVAGAGDTVAAILSLSLTAGAKLEEAVMIANHAAGIVVSKLGVATLSQKELKQSLKNE